VNFAVWENTTGDWVTEMADENVAGFNPDNVTSLSTDNDVEAKYVFFYQVINTDPLDASNLPLENFNVTKTKDNGDPTDHQPYRAGGYIEDTVFENARVYPQVRVDATQEDIDEGRIPPETMISGGGPNNWVPADLFDPLPFAADPDAVDPTGFRLSIGRSIASDSVRAGEEAYTGALWTFAPFDDNIPPDATSTVLFLTSEWRWNGEAPCHDNDGVEYCDELGIVWAETESADGFGAAGDVIGIKNVPEPVTLALLGVGLAGIGLTRRQRQAV
jgi:hypothetical protein